jgi:predicted dehydrogenase
MRISGMTRRDFLLAAAAAVSARSLVAAASRPRFRVGVIGHTGRGNYGHGLDTMWKHLPDTEVVAVADPVTKGREDAARRLGVEKAYSSYEEMLARESLDIVAVCPRFVDERHVMLLAAARAGVRGIYVEKPLARCPREADEIVAACAARGVRVAVAHRNRWHPVVPVVQRLISQGALGRILEMRARGKEDVRGGVEDMWVLGVHLFGLAHVLGGYPGACTATVLQAGRPVVRGDLRDGPEGIGPIAGDAVHARYEMPGGFPLFFDSLQGAGSRDAGFGLQIVGTEATLDFRADQEIAARLLAGRPVPPGRDVRRWLPVTSAGVDRPEPIPDLRRQVFEHVFAGRDLIAAIGEGREALCSARDAAITIEMSCAALESHRQDGRRVPLPLTVRDNPFLIL